MADVRLLRRQGRIQPGGPQRWLSVPRSGARPGRRRRMRSLGGGSIVGRGQGGRDVAYRWRFRHKLFLAHGLVVAIVLMLLGGTLYGLISYTATTRTFDKKLVELTKAEEFRSKI